MVAHRRPHVWRAALAAVLVLSAGSLATRSIQAQRTSEPPKPAQKDSPTRTRPKDAVFSTWIEPAEAKPGDTVHFKVKVKLSPGWHIYTQAKSQEGDGPRKTVFDLFDKGGLETVGDWKASKKPESRVEPAFENQVFEYFEDEVTWSIALKVPSDAIAGKSVIRCQASYQICSAQSCSFPGRWTLPDAVLTILSADTATTSPAPGPHPPLRGTFSLREKVSSSLLPQGEGGRRPDEGVHTPAQAPGPSSGPAPSSTSNLVSSPASAPSAPPAAPVSEVARRAQEGLVPFLIFSAIGGVFALMMPCVWPMIPITVNFFVKQGQDDKSKGKTTRLAVAYCLAIIGIFTAVGVLFSFFFSASFLQNLANNPWLNSVVAALFLAFGLSLLGLFEISLPSFLLNASSRGESRGGMIGVVFMALTLTITSFTCTFPVVGGLLVMAAGGKFLYPIIGLATFATVLALPFFLLALSPGLIAKVPRSGDWTNAVKVVGGLVEIGAAFKFLNAAELGYVTPEDAWFDASVVLTAWIVLAAVCGFYLLGFFRTDHDHDVLKVGPGRLVFGALFLGLALYMTPALFGRPPRSFIWERLIVGILPPDASEFAAGQTLAGGAVGEAAAGEAGSSRLAEVKASSKDPAQAQREEKKLHGVLWGMSFDQAKELASAGKKPILIDFTGVNCTNCRLMEQRVLPRPEVVKLLKEFVPIQLYTDFVQIASITSDERRELATKNQELQLDLTQEATNPFYVVLTPEGKLVSALGGYSEPMEFVGFLKKSLDQARGGTSVAQTLTRP
ncbi:MAG: cytochrome c biogenesis protein CcdA [Isosphaeraceae bacterium]